MSCWKPLMFCERWLAPRGKSLTLVWRPLASFGMLGFNIKLPGPGCGPATTPVVWPDFNVGCKRLDRFINISPLPYDMNEFMRKTRVMTTTTTLGICGLLTLHIFRNSYHIMNFSAPTWPFWIGQISESHSSNW